MHSIVIGSLSEVSSQAWNSLHGTHIPFLRYEFLSALEKHQCVGQSSGWIPQHILIFQDKTLVGAMPQYLKTNSYGELVFDWAWAEAYQRSGLDYYPKLVAAIPYTPATGPRLLIAPNGDKNRISSYLIQAALEYAKQHKLSSFHCLFPQQEDLTQFSQQGFMTRLGCQFHWKNLPGEQYYRDFDDYLDHFTSSKRKKIRRERRQVREADIVIQRLRADELSEPQWQAVYRHYCSTFDRLSGYATLSLGFFQELSTTMPEQFIVMLAEHNQQTVASAICFRDADTLYGRHWGCDAHFHNLHFEACYYQGLEYCIEHKLKRFDPGAQGEHKISRGFLPTPTWSAHWIAEPTFQHAIGDFLQRETLGMQQYIEELTDHSPFKQK
ncbi:MAG: N-acetyltransferase [Ectothiorhodospiraceae bacterium]|nr:N-acetyltransferase [Ectothiorhodospiraceae bacterium]